MDDPRTRDALTWSWTVPVAVLGLGSFATLIAYTGTPFAPLGGIVMVVLIFASIIRLVFWSRDRRRIRAVLRSGNWTLVNVVVLAHLLERDQDERERFLSKEVGTVALHRGDKVAAIIDPATGNCEGTWLPFTRANPWPGLDTRRWAWVVAAPGAKRAVVASVNRSHLVALRRGPGLSKALHDQAWNVLRSADVPPAPGGRPMGTLDAGVRHPPGEPELWPNRPMSVRARVAIVAALIAVTAGFGVSDTLAHRAKVENRQRLEQNGVVVAAKVLDDRSARGSSDSITIVILDGPHQGLVSTRRIEGSSSEPPDGEVTVLHSQSDINDFVIVGYDPDRRTTAWVFGAGTIAVAIGLWFTQRQATKHGQQ